MQEPLAPATLAVILLTCVVSIRAFTRRDIEERLIFSPRAILGGRQYYRLATSAFLHAGWQHLLFNMVSLYFFGNVIELVYGAGDFLAVYFGGILGGSLLSLYLHRHHDYRAYGASGGVCGVIYASIFLVPGGGIYLFPLPVPIPAWLYAVAFMAGSFYAMKTRSDGIGHDAHLGGAIIGLLVATALHPGIARHSPWLFATVTGISILLLAYLWVNPLLLPARAFVRSTRPRKPAKPDSDLPKHRWEAREVDRILEKIAAHGVESLRPEERRLLREVSEKDRLRAESKKPKSGLAI